MSEIKGYVLKPGEGVPGFDGSVKAGRSSTGGSLCVIESHTEGGAPRHVHDVDDEAFYVLDGLLTVECGGDVFEAGPRSFVFLPHGVPHSWDVLGGEPATLLMITAPAGLEEFLRDFHTASTREERAAIGAKYGITFVD